MACSTPTLASYAQLEARCPGGIAPQDSTRAIASLEDASAWIRAEAGEDWIDDTGALEAVPPVIVGICCSVARRVLDNPEGYTQESVAQWSASRSNASSDIYLTQQEKSIIHKVVGSAGGMVVVTLTNPYPPPPSYGDYYFLDDDNRIIG